MLVDAVYYRKWLQVKISQKETQVRVWEGSLFLGFITFVAPMCDSTCRVLPAGKAQASLSVQIFYRGFRA